VGVPRGLINRIQYDENTGCWNWKGSRLRGSHPYGQTFYQGKHILVHRLSAHLWLSMDLTDKRLVLHSCDNPTCFNPKHLFIGTQLENVADMLSKRGHYQSNKTHCANGHPYDLENTGIIHRRDGTAERHCRICHQAALRRWRSNHWKEISQ
jgi:hypothetical protein